MENKKLKEFDEEFPLSFFANENYQGKIDELEFSMWQEKETYRASARREKVKQFITKLIKENEKNDMDKITYKALKSIITDYQRLKGNYVALETAIEIKQVEDWIKEYESGELSE